MRNPFSDEDVHLSDKIRFFMSFCQYKRLYSETAMPVMDENVISNNYCIA